MPLGTLLAAEIQVGPQSIIRYNLYPAAQLQGRPPRGPVPAKRSRRWKSSALKMLPSTMGFDWTGIAFQEKRIGGEATLVFGARRVARVSGAGGTLRKLAVAVRGHPGRAARLLGVSASSRRARHYPRRSDNNIYTQIGIVLIIALASKNAILIVEFARELRLAGRAIHEAAVEAAQMRFRPIIMTSFAFILGVAPLVFATGAGAASRQSLGTAVCGGMITVNRPRRVLRAGLLRRDPDADRAEERPAQTPLRRDHSRSARSRGRAGPAPPRPLPCPP